VSSAKSPTGQSANEPIDDLRLLRSAHEAAVRLQVELAKRVVGQKQAIELLLTALFANGHALSIGVPGLAKTLMISTLSEAMRLQFKRVQFTPDMMPSDITGSEVLDQDDETGKRRYRFVQGPVFTQMLLADELNRTPPKTQAALLQAMQERQISVAGRSLSLEPPFLVLATQNPIEQHGTYPLPEAQLDRFLLAIYVDYPSLDEEIEVVRRTTSDDPVVLEPVLSPDEIVAIQALVRRVPVADHLVAAAVRLVRATRPSSGECPDALKVLIKRGGSPRASQSLIIAAKARAVIRGRETVTLDDLRAVAEPVLAHRIAPSYRAESESIDARQIVRRLLDVLMPT